MREGNCILAGVNPVSILEGGSQALAELPEWLAWHAPKYPAGGAIGYLAYELASAFESVSLAKFEFLPEF